MWRELEWRVPYDFVLDGWMDDGTPAQRQQQQHDGRQEAARLVNGLRVPQVPSPSRRLPEGQRARHRCRQFGISIAASFKTMQQCVFLTQKPRIGRSESDSAGGKSPPQRGNAECGSGAVSGAKSWTSPPLLISYYEIALHF